MLRAPGWREKCRSCVAKVVVGGRGAGAGAGEGGAHGVLVGGWEVWLWCRYGPMLVAYMVVGWVCGMSRCEALGRVN